MVAVAAAVVLELDINDQFDDFNSDIISPLYRAQVITADQPFNTNQNLMDLEYYATWDADRNLKRFYATMTLHLEKPDVG